GWRLLEKYAVRAGGGHNHRRGLYDAILIKDNHLAAAKGQLSLADIVQQARAFTAWHTPIEIEVDTLDQLRDVLHTKPDIVLLDNMTLEQMREAVALRSSRYPRVLLEASGGVTLQTVRVIAETGV